MALNTSADTCQRQPTMSPHVSALKWGQAHRRKMLVENVIKLRSSSLRILLSQLMRGDLVFARRGAGPCALRRMVIGP
ncbi:Uncharacterised protein [Mycobacteroides abscessus subsp. abscessus]|nr:Uncharacterised protein [Mycobacteroides abscessus subsp. abscessus]